jgi:hypothetical protein
LLNPEKGADVKVSIRIFVVFAVAALAVVVVGAQDFATVEAKRDKSSGVQAAADPPPVVVQPENEKGSYAPGNTLVLWGDTVITGGPGVAAACVQLSRFKPGQGVLFRMTAINPAKGEFAEDAELTVKIDLPSGTSTGIPTSYELPMKYRGPDDRPGFWTVKWPLPPAANWVFPSNNKIVLDYVVEARDSKNRTGRWEPFNVTNSLLTIVP